MALFKVELNEGNFEPFSANDYFELYGYTIFQTGEIKEVAIETKYIKEIRNITDDPLQETFTPFAIDPPSD